LTIKRNIPLTFNITGLTGPNIAHRKTAAQGPADLEEFTVAGLAVDGNLAVSNKEETCAHTTQGNTSYRAWWQVDLGDAYRITGIKIINRERKRKGQSL